MATSRTTFGSTTSSRSARGHEAAVVPLLPSAAMEIMGIQIRTIISDNVANRCDGCLEVIDGTPWRINLLDIVAAEAPVAWTDRPAINPGPFQFHGDPACVRRWMAEQGLPVLPPGRGPRDHAPGPRSRRDRAGALGPVRRHPPRRPRVRPGLTARRSRGRVRRLTADSGAPILRPPGPIVRYPDLPRFIPAMPTGRIARLPPRSPDPSAPAQTTRPRVSRRRPPPRRRALAVARARRAGCSASTPTRCAAGRMRAGSRPTSRPAAIAGSTAGRSSGSSPTRRRRRAGRWRASGPAPERLTRAYRRSYAAERRPRATSARRRRRRASATGGTAAGWSTPSSPISTPIAGDAADARRVRGRGDGHRRRPGAPAGRGRHEPDRGGRACSSPRAGRSSPSWPASAGAARSIRAPGRPVRATRRGCSTGCSSGSSRPTSARTA